MNKLSTFSLCLIISFSAIAQKAKVVSAYNYNKSYERDKDCDELVKGIESIEPAVKDPKTNTWAKTWYYGGNLYFNAALTKDEECASKFEDALAKSYEFYLKSMKYNIEEEGSNDLDLSSEEDLQKLYGYFNNKDTKYDDPSYFRDIFGNKFPYLAQAFINEGVEAFNSQNYEKAKKYSENSIQINAFLGKLDSLGIYNAALSAERLDMLDEAIEYYTALTKIKYGGPAIYLYLANLYLRKNDTAMKVQTIRDGLEVYPDHPDLNREELAYLLSQGKTEEALSNFDQAIKGDPENPTLYFNRGVIFDELGKTEEAAKDYKKALEIDPKYFDAAYNLGAMYFNRGVEWNKKAGSYDMDEQDKYEQANQKAKEFFSKAEPILEKAHQMNPEDKSTIASLVQVYAMVGKEEKYKAMKAKLGGN